MTPWHSDTHAQTQTHTLEDKCSHIYYIKHRRIPKSEDMNSQGSNISYFSKLFSLWLRKAAHSDKLLTEAVNLKKKIIVGIPWSDVTGKIRCLVLHNRKRENCLTIIYTWVQKMLFCCRNYGSHFSIFFSFLLQPFWKYIYFSQELINTRLWYKDHSSVHSHQC